MIDPTHLRIGNYVKTGESSPLEDTQTKRCKFKT